MRAVIHCKQKNEKLEVFKCHRVNKHEGGGTKVPNSRSLFKSIKSSDVGQTENRQI